MNRTIKNARKAGASPGTLIHIGENYNEEVKITLIEYSKDEYEKKYLKEEELASLKWIKVRTPEFEKVWTQEKGSEVNKAGPLNKESPISKISWLNIDGLAKIEIIEKIGQIFKLHPLVLEDILNTGQRTKVEDYDDYLFVVLKMITVNEENNELKSEQISIVLIDNYVITFKETGGNIFDNVKNRIQAGKGNIRKLGKDYLLYALIDTIVDSYFVILENFGNKIDDAEDDLMQEPRKEILQEIHNLKREMLFLRNSLWPLREVISNLIRSEDIYINQSTIIYFRDIYDHTIQIIDTIEVYRDILSGMLDTYLSSISNKTNEIMKVLTILSTIFIPITFLAGVYGMNFAYEPELKWRWSYGGFWLVSITSTVLMLRFFRKKKWM